MKKLFYLIPLFLLFFIPKAYALPDCTLISNATLYDVNSASNVSSISTYKDSELLCNTIHSAYATSDASHGLGWNIDLTSINNGNSYYQLDVFMYSQVSDGGRIPITNSSFRNNSISIGTNNTANLWANGSTNISNFNYNLSTYYDVTSGRTYEVISYIFKANVNFNKIFVPFATYGLYTGYFDLIGISLTNTGQSSLTETEINNLFSAQTNNLKTDINTSIYNTEENINNNIDDMENSINDSLKDNFNVCEAQSNLFNKNTITSGHYMIGDGSLLSKSDWFVTDYIYVVPTQNYIISGTSVTGDKPISYAFYDASKNLVSVHYHNDYKAPLTITIPSHVYYIRDSVYIGDLNTYTFGKEVCQNRLDSTNDKLDSVNDSINDLNSSINDSNSDGATNSAGNFFNNFEDNDFGLSGIITAPLNTIKTITSNSCTPINLTIPFVNKNMSLPCMTDIYEEHFGSFLDIYQIITFGMISYWVCVQIYAMVKGFKNPDKDEIEVMDL